MSSLTGPPPLTTNPLVKIRADIAVERRSPVPFPPGETRFSMARTQRFAKDPLPVLLEAYARYGPVFTLRILHGNTVFVLGPEANHHVLVSHARNFSYREGYMSDLFPLLGDGLLTIDGDFHRRSRRIMLPAFHKEQIAASIGAIEEEVELAIAPWRDGARIDLYEWTRELALRIAMRALFGLRNESAPQAAHDFEQALGFYAQDYLLQALRGPGTPWARMRAARARLDVLIHGEIERRRATGERGTDILSLLLDAHDEDGATLSRTHIRDEVMTLLFAGHDTTTSTISFMFHELARQPHHATAPMDRLLDETLRMYPPAWIGPRRSIEAFELCGQRVPGGVAVNYCSWASHHLPDVWEDPARFDPDRFAPGRREAIPKGAYVPFGGGSRTCIGMRFAQAEVDVIARRILGSWRLQLDPGYHLSIRQMPTISPRNGMPMTVRAA
ncbi:MAG: cytochrome [Solirubrobacterales bacterium]|nr:cytochrome [Solirubrobacterales bacterium]